MFELDKALSEPWLDCGQYLHKQIIELGGAVKVWITLLVRYEPVIVDPVKCQFFEKCQSAQVTCIFMRNGTITAPGNPYIDSLLILTDCIKEFSEKFICNQSGLRIVKVLQLILKMAEYAPIQGCGWQFLPMF